MAHLLSKQPAFPERQIIVDPRLDNERDYVRLLRQIDAVLPGEGWLRLRSAESGVSTLLWDPDIYSLGVYETRRCHHRGPNR